MRIAVVGISYEALLRSPVPTRKMDVWSGKDMLGRNLWMVRGVEKRFAEDADVELVPIQWATALPGGGFTRAIYDEVKNKALAGLKAAGKLDGVVIVNHGAMEVHDLGRHPDTDFVAAVSDLVGPDVPLAIALDHHGHVSPEIFARISALSALRTAPHRDDLETGYRAADQLLAVIRTGQRQHMAAVRLPVLIPGEMAMTTTSPARELFGLLPGYDAIEGMVEANFLVGFAWNDKPWIGMTAIAQSTRSREQAVEVATDLARKIWDARKDFQLRMEHAEVEDGLSRAANAGERPIFLADSGDNTTAGAPGDLTTLLRSILARPELEDVVVAGITAPSLVERCQAAGIGASIMLSLGQDHLSAPKTAFEVKAEVEALGAKLVPDGFATYMRQSGPWARVRIGHVTATFHADPVGMISPTHFELLGIHPTDHRIYVVKLGYLHPKLEDIAGRYILLMTDGASNLDVTRLPFTQINRPAYPLEKDATWSPEPNLFTTQF